MSRRKRYTEMPLPKRDEDIAILVMPLGTEPDHTAVLSPLVDHADMIEQLRGSRLVLHTFEGCAGDIVQRVRARLLEDVERAALVARGRRLAAGVSAGALAALSVGTWLIPDPAGITDEWLFPLGALIGLGAWRVLEPRMRGYQLYQQELPAKLDQLEARKSPLITALYRAICAWEEGDMDKAVVHADEWRRDTRQSRHAKQVVAALEDHFQLRRLPRETRPLPAGHVPERLERKRCAILNATGASAAALDVYRLFVASYSE